MRSPLSLYVHIPFCQKKCNYCAFVSGCASVLVQKDYLTALKNEITLRAKELSGSKEVKTIYIGGGTPSVLELGDIKNLLNHIYQNFVVSNDAEITIEANPSSLTPEKAKEYVGVGITRFSMGLQAKQSHHLKTLGRLHTAQTFKDAVSHLKSAGATNISGDIMLGLPNQTAQEVRESVLYLKNLGVQHISIYMLEVEEGTVFKKLQENNLLPLPKENETINLYNTAKETLENLGFNRYEFSNFALRGYESKHNQIYWQGEEYLGLGAGAHSYINKVRFANTSKISKYLTYINKNQIPLEYKDELTKEEQAEEEIMLKLRTVKGLNLNSFATKYGKEYLETKKETIKSLIKDGYVKIDNAGNLTATNNGFMVLNKIIEMLI